VGPETRPSNLGLMQALLEKPYTFSFFQAVRLLERYLGGPRLGHQGPSAEEPIRLIPAVSMSFPAADLQSIELQHRPESEATRFVITNSFLGLFSSDSPLPTFYTEDRFWKETDQDVVRAFMDMFHHRALSLFYRAWEKYRYSIVFKRRGEDIYSRRLLSLIGLGTDALIANTGLPSVRIIRYAGLITCKAHSAASLRGILRDYFGLPHVGIQQCRERWVPIHSSQQNRLGARNCALGRDLSIGNRVRDLSSKFRISVGPLTYPTFQKFVPDAPDYAALVNLTRLLVTDRLEFDMEVKLKHEAIPELRLSSSAPLRLGWTSWLPSRKSFEPSVIFRPPHSQIPQTSFPWPEPPAEHQREDLSARDPKGRKP